RCDGGRAGLLDQVEIAVVLVIVEVVQSGCRVLEIGEQHLAEEVGVDGGGAAVGQRFDGRGSPVIVPARSGAGAVLIRVRSQASRAGGAASPLDDGLRDAAVVVVLEESVGIGGDLGVGQAIDVGAQGGHQPGVRLRAEGILEPAAIAVGVAGHVTSVVAGVEHVASTVGDLAQFQVFFQTVGVLNV